MIEHRHTWVYSPTRKWRTCKFCGEQQQIYIEDGEKWVTVGTVTITSG